MPDYKYYLNGQAEEPLLQASLPNETGIFQVADGTIEQDFSANNPNGFFLQIKELHIEDSAICNSGCRVSRRTLTIDHPTPKQITFSREGKARIGSGRPFIEISRTT